MSSSGTHLLRGFVQSLLLHVFVTARRANNQQYSGITVDFPVAMPLECPLLTLLQDHKNMQKIYKLVRSTPVVKPT